jgi:Phosphotransferase enzyme family
MCSVIDGLDDVLANSGQHGLPELRTVLQELFSRSGSTARVTGQQRLKRSVYRLRLEANGGVRSVVLKRLGPGVAQRNQFVATRWLPTLSLSGHGPVLLGVAAERSGRCVWHIYEDLGGRTLAAGDADPRQVEAAVALIAQLHTCSAGHALLPQVRLYGDDLGMYFYVSNVRDAIYSLEALQRSAVELSTEHSALCDRLLARLHKLLAEQADRAHVMAELGGPEVLLHGDLWTTNVLVCSTEDGLHARLIDWDHVGVGPISYDLSTFLCRFPPADRHWILDLYREAVELVGWRLPSAADLNLLFDIAEQARLANSVIWPALALLSGPAEWGFDELAACERWFEMVTPVLPLAAERHGDRATRESGCARRIEPAQPAPVGSSGLPRRADQ